jgi:hypothetical protein
MRGLPGGSENRAKRKLDLPDERRSEMKKATLVLAAVLIATLAVGCSGSKSETQSKKGKIIGPCELISKTDAEQLIGEPMKDPQERDNKVVGQKLCIYESAKKDSFRFFQISITQQAFMPTNGQSPKSIYESLKANFPNAVHVEGIGDDAFIAPPGLHVIKGDYYITIGVGNSSDPKNREILKAAGEKAVDNLLKLTSAVGTR